MVVGSHFGFTSDFQGDKNLAPLYISRSSRESYIRPSPYIRCVSLPGATVSLRPATAAYPSLYASPELGGLLVDNMLHVIALTLSCA